MTTFPSIEPDNRAYDIAGDFPMVGESSWPSFSTRYRTGRASAAATSLTLSLTFLDRPQSEWLQLREHYNNQQGGSFPFELPEIVLQGQTFSLTRPDTMWRYAAPPQEQHKSGSLFDVTIQLESGDYIALLPVIIDLPTAETLAFAVAPQVSNDGIGVNVPIAETISDAQEPLVSNNGVVIQPATNTTIAATLTPSITTG
jgi:hypothetical protein